MSRITTNLWFDTQAEEAANFYVSIFKNSRIKETTRYDETVANVADMPVGTVMTILFELDGHPFVGLNGGPMFKFSEAISLIINCDNAEEVDYFWSKLTEGGEESMCGWLKDKFGLSWQVVPTRLMEMLSGSDPGATKRAVGALMEMRKIDLPTLERAYAGQ